MICPEAESIIKHCESLSLEPYTCPAGIWTIGWGSTWGLDGKRVTGDHPAITVRQAQWLFERDVRRTEVALVRLVSVRLFPAEYGALVSLIYNIGSGNFQGSTLRQKLNRGDYDGAAGEFWKWRRAGGKILRGLVARRAEEVALFRSEAV